MDSYDRLFPSQDTLPAGGFGNLIALPLQRAAREHDNTVFLDDQLEPYAINGRSWRQSLGSRRSAGARSSRAPPKPEAPLGVADPNAADLTPWRPAPPLRVRLRDSNLPAEVSATLAQRLYVDRDGLPAALVDALRRLAAFANPEFAERQAMRLSTGLTPRVIACFEDLGRHLALPRGCLHGCHRAP